MAREDYQQQLDVLREEIIEMGEIVLTRFEKATTALEDGDVALAERIADADHEINERYLDLEGDCIDLFALQQPVASDLRFVAASFKILTDLERIADLAANLAAYVVASDRSLQINLSVTDIAETAIGMISDALDAYVDGDADRCFAVAERDDDIDGRCERAAQQIIRDAVAHSGDPDALESELEEVTRLLLTIRDLERIGDHAVNIAARTLYMIESDDALIY